MLTIEQMVLAFLTERRLNDEEAAFVVQLAKYDSRFSFLAEIWNIDETVLSFAAKGRILNLVCKKVLIWMDRNAEKHSARALFTGES